MSSVYDKYLFIGDMRAVFYLDNMDQASRHKSTPASAKGFVTAPLKMPTDVQGVTVEVWAHFQVSAAAMVTWYKFNGTKPQKSVDFDK